jgi:hypothetical protein
MASEQYHGVFTSTSATRYKSSTTDLSKTSGQQLVEVKATGGSTTPVERRDYSTKFTIEELQGEQVNMAQLRLVSLSEQDNIPEFIENKSYIGFILTSVNESSSEKVEIIPLPGDSFTSYFFGRNPRTYSIQGILLNTKEDAWRDSFEILYEDYLRGTKAISQNRIMQLKYDNRIVTGWPLQMSMSVDSASDVYVSFSLALLVTRVDILNYSLNEGIKPYLRNQANFGADLNKFKASDIESLTNIVRTGYTIPPPRPRSSGGVSSVPSDCFLKAPPDNGADSEGQGIGEPVSTSLASSAECSYVETYRDTAVKINELVKTANAKKGTKEADDALAEAARLQRDIEAIKTSEAFIREVRSVAGDNEGVLTLAAGAGGKKKVEVYITQEGELEVFSVDKGSSLQPATYGDIELQIGEARENNTSAKRAANEKHNREQQRKKLDRKPRVVKVE